MRMTKSFVFDSNTLISGFMFRNSIPRAAYNKAVKIGVLTASIETFNEFKTTFSRAKFDAYISQQDRLLVFEELEEILEFSLIKDRIIVCRDPKDDKYLELAVSVQADCIVTGDKDLLVLHPFRGIPIMNASDFLEHI